MKKISMLMVSALFSFIVCHNVRAFVEKDREKAWAYSAGDHSITLSGADLSSADLTAIQLAGANMSQSNCRNINFGHATLENVNLKGANLKGANLYSATLAEANLADSDLAYAYLADANLEGANLEGANLKQARFENTTMPNGKKYTGDGEDYKESLSVESLPVVGSVYNAAEAPATDYNDNPPPTLKASTDDIIIKRGRDDGLAWKNETDETKKENKKLEIIKIWKGYESPSSTAPYKYQIGVDTVTRHKFPWEKSFKKQE